MTSGCMCLYMRTNTRTRTPCHWHMHNNIHIKVWHRSCGIKTVVLGWQSSSFGPMMAFRSASLTPKNNQMSFLSLWFLVIRRVWLYSSFIKGPGKPKHKRGKPIGKKWARMEMAVRTSLDSVFPEFFRDIDWQPMTLTVQKWQRMRRKGVTTLIRRPWMSSMDDCQSQMSLKKTFAPSAGPTFKFIWMT